MIPVLFKIGPFTIYSFGLMLGIGFLVGYKVLDIELRRKLGAGGTNIASTVTLLGIVFGISGAKLLFLIEELPNFLRDPLGMALSPGGLTWYGGFALAMLAVFIFIRRKHIPYLVFLDALGPAMMIGYGVGRIGCHLAGDGDYGFPTSLPWGTDYSHGTDPPSRAFANFPEIASRYPGGIVPDHTPLHPTPVYEFILGVIGFLILWRLRKKPLAAGKLFMIYLMLATLFRFSVEFLRLNPRLLWGLSEAQLISVPVFVFALVWYFRLDRPGKEAPGH